MNLTSIAPEKLTAQAKLFLVGAILNGIGNGIFNVIMQLYFSSIGFNGSALGSIFMMNAISATVLTIPMGLMADHFGKKKIISLGTASVTFSIFLILASRRIELIMVGFLAVGVSNAAAVVFSPLYSSFFDKEELDKAFGLWGALNIVTMSMGSLLGFVPPYLAENYGFTLQSAYWTFLVIGAFFFVSQYFFYLLSTRGATETKKQNGFKLTLTSKDLVARISLIHLISGVSIGVFFSLFPFYVNSKFGIQSDALGSLFFASNFVSAGAQAVAPRVSKKLGTLRTIGVVFGLATPFYLMMPLAPSFLLLSVLYVMRLGFGTMAQPLLSSTLMKHLKEDEKSTANSIRMMSMQGGNIVGPWLGGQLMERASLDMPAYLGGGLYAVLTMVTLFLTREKGEKVELPTLQLIEASFEDPLQSDSKPTPLVD